MFGGVVDVVFFVECDEIVELVKIYKLFLLIKLEN